MHLFCVSWIQLIARWPSAQASSLSSADKWAEFGPKLKRKKKSSLIASWCSTAKCTVRFDDVGRLRLADRRNALRVASYCEMRLIVHRRACFGAEKFHIAMRKDEKVHWNGCKRTQQRKIIFCFVSSEAANTLKLIKEKLFSTSTRFLSDLQLRQTCFAAAFFLQHCVGCACELMLSSPSSQKHLQRVKSDFIMKFRKNLFRRHYGYTY